MRCLFVGLDVMKGLWAKKHAKMHKNKPELPEKPERVHEKPKRSELDKDHQVNSFKQLLFLLHLYIR